MIGFLGGLGCLVEEDSDDECLGGWMGEFGSVLNEFGWDGWVD